MTVRPLVRTRILAVALTTTGIISCSGDAVLRPPRPGELPPGLFTCDLDTEFLIQAAAIGAIPDIQSPRFVLANERVPDYLDPDTRVIGLTVGENQFAIPHNVLWRHEVLNMSVGGTDLVVTYCPLTGSSLAFNRDAVDGATFGVSGLLYRNNLVLFDDGDLASRWPQMVGQARCGVGTGTSLDQWPVVEMLWSSWFELHPFTWVLDGDQGFESAGEPWTYEAHTYPYGDYETSDEMFKPAAMPALDPRRHPKERVLGVPSSATDLGIAFPFGALEAVPGDFTVLEFVYQDEPAIALWGDEAQGGMAFHTRTSTGEIVTLSANASGFIDAETGSHWSVDGRATAGPMKNIGARLVPLERAYVAFWGAWAAFHPDTRLWEG